MGGLYIGRSEAEALRTIDLRELDRLVEDAIWQSRSGELHALRIASCGAYVSSRLYRFDQAVVANNKAKAAKKRAETATDLRRAGMDLVDAVREMKDRLEEDEKEQELVHVDDIGVSPRTFTPRMSIRISYRWRETPEDTWTFGAITFEHEHDTSPDYSLPRPTRKLSKARQEDELQDTLYRVWDHLRISALQSVREYLTSGRDWSAIPETYRVTTGHSRYLNNYSTQFWRTGA